MALDREQWIHLATANAAIIRADLDQLRSVLTEGPQVGYAEFWAQARDIAAKFKTFKPLEAEAREILWSDYRAICDATRALQESERGQSSEESKAKRAQIEAELAKAAEVVEAAQTPQELSKAQSLLDQILNQMKTRPAKGAAPRKGPATATPPDTKDEGEAVASPASEPASGIVEDQPAEQAPTEAAEAVTAIPAAEPEETATETEVVAVEEQAGAPADASIPVAEIPAGEIPAGEEQQGAQTAAQAEVETVAPAAESLPAGAAERDDAHKGAGAPILLRSDREACWTRWTQIRDILKAKRAQYRRGLLEAAVGHAREIFASMETQDPRTVQEAIRVAQAELKTSGLTLAEQETVRTTLRGAWKACSERIDALRQERQKAHAEWLERMTTHLSRWETQVLKNQATAVQIQSEVADLESQAAGTGDEGRISKLRQWINAKSARMAGLEASSKELAEKIRTVRSKMGKEAPPPITELSEEDLAAASRPSPSVDRRPRPDREPGGSGRGPRRAPREERPIEPVTHPGLNLGDLLAKHFGLTPGAKATDLVVEKSPVQVDEIKTAPVPADQVEVTETVVPAEAEPEMKTANDEDAPAEV